MQPTEHYREAERLLADGRGFHGNYLEDAQSMAQVAAAQVHATLALAGSQLRSLAAEEDSNG